MSGGSSPPPANTTSTTSQNPWAGATPYLRGDTGKTGVFPAAEQYFNQYSQLDPARQGFNSDYFGQLSGRSKQTQDFDLGQQFLGGQFNPTAGMTGGRTADAAQSASALGNSYQGNLQSGMQALGGNNPQQALGSLLSGRPDNPYLGAMNQANINQSLRGYNDAISNLSQTVLPQLSNEAFASGQYGSSRQGIAEGLALQEAQRNARDLGIAAMDSGNQLFGGAYESAQGRMGDTANMLTGQAADMERFNAGQLQQGGQFNADALNAMRQFNAGNIQQANQFNAGQWQNADQFNANLDMQQQAARAQNALQGLDVFKDQYAIQDNIFNQQQQLLGANQAQTENALNLYANIISPGAGMGGISTSNSQIPIYGNSTGQILGGASSIAGLLSSMGG